jgi:hypothetical protein
MTAIRASKGMESEQMVLLKWLDECAAAQKPCPTNPEIAERFGRKSISFAAELMAALEASGRVTVERTRVARRVTIVDTGAATVWKPLMSRERKPREPRQRTPKPKPAPKPVPAAVVAAAPWPTPKVANGERGCRWPLWGKGRPTHLYCGEQRRDVGCPYCAAHAKRAYVDKTAPRDPADGVFVPPPPGGRLAGQMRV